ncbi:hypothetical protein DZC75_10685 [Pseudomonas parafulva]|uniref:Uncharacterized protein n=1 Tax=Pseudomonas parafulva TaxID=157782 RepID=A0AAI8PBG7_9PSED|nr:hypothetical protein [Pseudomonas parafulva]AXO88440.1 hypothetical protein DZC75_10685 [Pseudomonas parafulva]
MASPKKQEKGEKIADQAAPAPLDSSTTSPSSEGAPATTTGVATTAMPEGATGPHMDTATQAPSVAAHPPVEPVLDPSANVGGSGAAQTAETEIAAENLAPGEEDGDGTLELNPSRIEVYPLRSFMDDGELRRRGGPGYLVLRQHAEELEQRGLVSRQPLED